MSKKRTVSIGGATYDLFVQTGSDVVRSVDGRKVFDLPLGHKIRVKNVVETCGGGANNTAVGLSRLGCSAQFCGVLGDDKWGETLLKNFKKEGVDVSAVTIVEGEMSSFSIILSASSGERTILYEAGTNEHLHDANFSRESLKSADWVYLNHIQENSCVIQNDIVDMLTGDAGIHFSWNPGGCQIDAGLNDKNNSALLRQTDLLLLNKEEALRFTGAKTKEDAIKTLLAAGAKVVCVTDGGNGSTASDGKNLYHCPVVKDAPVVDTTGAGDAFGTGVTWAFVQGLELPTALLAGTMNATSVVGTLGAQDGLLTDTQMHTKLSSTPLVVDVTAL
jgi:ribokinase